ncbi:DJ-1/PfpI family protein [Jannaschia marina]|uniref:DJ-1/PfpI family protein n=1 Tax=Jannaschia marina TaxID=2741674 RepID=UPI001ABB1459|nr:DJ-1/PfpI family protein [Jannaschia marina]
MNAGQAQDTDRSKGPKFAMLVHPKMIMQDLIGPMTVFNLCMGTNHLVWKDATPVASELGISVMPTETYETCPRDVDVLFVPGGLAGTIELMQDSETLAFLQDVASTATYVTSVCTGALVLGAAGLLQGKRATSHWYVRDMLTHFGAIQTEGRVVEDGRVLTGGGVTAGIDFGLTIASRLRGDDWARRIMLTLEYAPEPPFIGGTPEQAEADHVASILDRRGRILAEAERVAREAGKRL